jgi:hypothetical protein
LKSVYGNTEDSKAEGETLASPPERFPESRVRFDGSIGGFWL